LKKFEFYSQGIFQTLKMVRPGDNNDVEETDEANPESAKASLDDSHDPYFPPIVSLPLVEVCFVLHSREDRC
jgi:hypothetical protein